MEFGVKCVACILNKEINKIENYEDARKREYINQIMRIFIEEEGTAPLYQYMVDRKHEEFWGDVPSIYKDAKQEHNRLMLQQEEKYSAMVEQSDTPLETAIKIAGAGNYIDMGAMAKVEISTLLNRMQEYIDHELDKCTYETFYKQLKMGKNLVYLTDNCGEIVFDKVLIRAIRKEFPHLNMCAIVKGKPVLNDVTREDAEYVGLTDCIEIIDNGTAIAGTCLEQISEPAKMKIQEADVIISKGQGNFETLSGCGLNIYYLLLCKCEYFASKLQKKQMEMAFINESSL